MLGVLAAAFVFLLLFDFKSFAERRATAALGRPVTIGVLEVKFFPLECALDDLLVADVPGGPAGAREQAALHEGRICKLNPLVFGVNQGKISIDLTVNSRARPMKADAVATVQSYPLSRLVGKTGGESTSWGAIGGKIELHGTGNSLHRILFDRQR